MRKAIQIIIILCILALIFLVPAEVIGDGLHIISGYVESDKVEISHSLPDGDYQVSILHEDKTTTTVPIKGTAKYQKMSIDNMNNSPFVRAIIASDESQILWTSIGIDIDCD